ncbi:hypothetical protein OF117_02275 [Geodermatophilus sp. YIM 151500]|uniref:hypothetical protein n=1 Tax=Geodermatophilus sp. YIM 151500 TaxID=2984531 RepID=UPI0021E454A6|nr:hypothetical protein [Geodermatophilus sp. YIM 151500]MCV2488178.1 hypothetical protein [Geodermatophilus sp. YIM 151500]
MTAAARRPFAHEAVLSLGSGTDDRAAGGAITTALCGSWSHEPPCPLAPHHTAVERTGDTLRVRVLFTAAPEDEPRVRSLVEGVLAAGGTEGPDGVRAAWRLVEAGPSAVRAEEQEHAERLVAAP